MKWIETASRVGNEDFDYDADQIVDMSSREEDNKTLLQTLKLVLQSKLMMTYTAVESFLWWVVKQTDERMLLQRMLKRRKWGL